MKLALIIASGSLTSLIIFLLAVASIYNISNDRKPEAQEFLSGKLPEPSPDGDYKGQQFTGLGKNWQGKNFNAAKSSGINNFKSKNGETEQRHPFIVVSTHGLRNKSTSVLQLNYNIGNNPLWLKLIRDELVQVSPKNYLGKIQLKVGFVVVTLGYFRLSN